MIVMALIAGIRKRTIDRNNRKVLEEATQLF